MQDYTNFRMSAEATSIVERMREKFKFPTQISAIKFCIAYSLKYHLQDMNFDNLDTNYPSDGANFHVGSIDDDGTIKRLIPIYFSNCETPYRYARVAAIFGSKQIAKKMDDNPNLSLFDLL